MLLYRAEACKHLQRKHRRAEHRSSASDNALRVCSGGAARAVLPRQIAKKYQEKSAVYHEERLAAEDNFLLLFWVAAVFIYFSILRPFAFTIVFAAAFFGVILRVVKNCFRQAIAIREENDYTI